MRTMSLFESLDSNGEVSLNDIMLQKEIHGINETSFEKIAFLICRGGFPASIQMKDDSALFNLRIIMKVLLI